MNLNQKARDLLLKLRAAIDEALGDSSNVLAAMVELEDAGFSPSFCVDVELQEETGPPLVESVSLDQGLILTVSDEWFLRTIGIATPGTKQVVT